MTADDLLALDILTLRREQRECLAAALDEAGITPDDLAELRAYCHSTADATRAQRWFCSTTMRVSALHAALADMRKHWRGEPQAPGESIREQNNRAVAQWEADWLAYCERMARGEPMVPKLVMPWERFRGQEVDSRRLPM